MSARKRQKLGNASDTKAESKREQLTLTIQPAPPAFPFVDHAFELTTYLMGAEGNLRTGLEVPLLVTAVLEGQDAAHGEQPDPQQTQRLKTLKAADADRAEMRDELASEHIKERPERLSRKKSLVESHPLPAPHELEAAGAVVLEC